jgi:Mg2+ and Co2+ transporter CorA
MLPLTLIASIFGMNVRVPGQGEIEAFWIVSASWSARRLLGYFRTAAALIARRNGARPVSWRG